MLYITVEVSAGLLIEEACSDMVNLAKKLDIMVKADFNGVEIFVGPRTVPSQAAAEALKALKKAR